LVDPASGLRIDSKSPGLFSVALPPHQAFIWSIEP
jgi:hypothetical protein